MFVIRCNVADVDIVTMETDASFLPAMLGHSVFTSQHQNAASSGRVSANYRAQFVSNNIGAEMSRENQSYDAGDSLRPPNQASCNRRSSIQKSKCSIPGLALLWRSCNSNLG